MQIYSPQTNHWDKDRFLTTVMINDNYFTLEMNDTLPHKIVTSQTAKEMRFMQRQDPVLQRKMKIGPKFSFKQRHQKT